MTGPLVSARSRRALATLATATLSVGALAGPALAAPAAPDRAAPHPTCTTAHAGQFRCFSQWHGTSTTSGARGSATGTLPAGYGPADIAAAYRLPSVSSTTLVAIVDAYDNPNAEADLAVSRTAFGLAPCTTANGCFRKVNQRGGTTPPAGDPGWGLEIALDVQAVSAACPTCRILLVEADDSTYVNIGKAVNRAVALGAKIVSNSYGGDEFGSSRKLAASYYTHPGVAQVVSSGDDGFTTAQFPAVLPQAVAVGGTTLTTSGAGRWTEQAWGGSGSGCSAWYPKPTWQKGTDCRMRTTADVSAVGDPQTGLSVYDTYGLGADNSWVIVGGTSLSAPLIAGMIGRAGNPAAMATAQRVYGGKGVTDVVGGANGWCNGSYLCTGAKGYDGPTGVGSPKGLAAL